MKIIEMSRNSEYFEDVIELGNANRSTLGFLPRGAYESYASQGKILISVDGKNVFGYLLYNINKGGIFVYISHLCVDESQRGKGIGRSLIDELKQRTKDVYHGIRVRCRRDWEANEIWPKYDFVAKNEIPGRSKEGSRLTVWWYDYGHPNLFQLVDEKRLDLRAGVVIDANVFFDLKEKETVANRESKALLADWLQEEIELCLTKEIFNEINRNEDGEQRNKSRVYADSFVIVSDSDNKYQKVKRNLKKFFPSDLDEQDASNLRQLARTIAADVQFFVTHDDGVLDIAEEVYNCFGLRIMRPTDLIIHQDALVREMEYQPARLAGSLIKTQRVQSEQIQFLQENFRAPQDETKSDFRNRLLSCLSDPQSCHTKIIQGNDGPLAVIAYRLKREDRLEISVFRVSAGALDSTLARYLVFQTVINATQEFRRKLIVVTDDYLAEEVISALLENGFVKIDSMWVRSSILAVEKAQTLRSRLHKIGRHIPFAKEYFHKIATIISSGVEDEKRSALLEVEKSLWPTKIIDLGIPAFVIPIQPKWAKDLFDSELASQTLFGSNPGLIFRSENVYYRSSQQKILEAPARILWYVSEGSGNYQGVKSIKACSYLDEVLIDTPKNLYSRFRRLGVFTWDDVYNIAKHNIDQEIMAFRFSKTELFDDPISLSDLRQIWLEDTGVQFNPITSRKISSELFFRLYKIGIGDSYA